MSLKSGVLWLVVHVLCVDWTLAWMNPFAEQAMLAAGGGAGSISPFQMQDPAAQMLANEFVAVGAAAGNPFHNTAGGASANPFNMQSSFPSMNPYRSSSSSSIGSICYCDVRINKLGTPGDLLFKLHYPTINAQSCQMAIQQCTTACKTQAQRQLTGLVDFESGGLENVVPEKDVSVGTMLCKEHSKIVSPPGVVASVFAKPDACGRAIPLFDLTGEETRLCCTLIAHPYIRTEHVLVFSPECIAGVPPPTAKGAAATGAAGAAGAGEATAGGGAAATGGQGSGGAGGNGGTNGGSQALNLQPNNAGPPQAPEPVPYNQMPQYRHYDPVNAMMMNAFG